MVIISLPLAFTVLFRSPLVQTLSARLATDWFANKIEREVNIEAINFSFYDGIYISGLELKDHKDSTILAVDKLKALPEFPWINSINFAKVELEGAFFALARYDGDEDFGFLSIIHDLQNESTSGGSEFELKIDNITLKNGRFRFYDESMDYQTERGMDYGDMDYFGINAILKDFDLINDSLMIDIIMLQTQEKSGLKVENVSTKFSISSTLMEVNNTILNTEKSSLDFDLDFNYKSYSDMSEFLDSVLMKTTIKSSEINMAELGYFSDIMFEMPNVIKVTGSGIGTVRELSGNNLVIEYGDNTKVTGGFYIRGLPDFFTSYIQLGIQDFNTTICDIQSFNLPIEGNYLNLPFNIKCNEVINLSGNFKGYYTDFESNIQLFYDESSINSNIVFNEGKNDSISLVGSVNANGFHIGKLLEMQDLMGRASFNSKLEIKGIYPDKLTYDYELIISDIFLLNNDLKRLRFKGNIKDNIVKSNYRVADKKMLAFGDFNFNINKYSLDLNSNIKRADIYKLGFWGEPLLLSSGLSLSLEGKDINEMDLELELVDLSMKFKQDEYLLSLLNFTKDRNSENNNLLKLESTIADATLSGQFNITTVANSTLSLIDSYYKFFDPAMPNPEDENVSFSINFKKPKFFNKHLFNGIEIENGSTINADIDFVNKLIDAQIYSEAMSVFGVDMVSNSLIVTSNSDFLNLNYSADRVVFKDSSDYDKTVLGLDSLNIDTRMMNNYLGYSFQWNNSNSKLENRGLLKGSMVHDSVFDNFSIDYSDVVINNSNWKVDTNNIIGFIPGGIKIENLNIYADNSKLEVEGEYFGRTEDTLAVNFEKWNVSFFDIITRMYGFNIDGVVDGYLNIGTIGDNPTFVSNLNFDNLFFNNQYLGRAHILNTWDNHNESIYLKAQIINDEREILNQMFLVDGYYYPFRSDDVLDISVSYNDFKIAAIQPYLDSYISELEGKSTGKLSLKGNFEKPELTGYAKIDSTSLIIKYLNTRYLFSNLIVFEKDMLHFDELVLYDTLGNKANINGFMRHDYFSNSELNVNISTDKLLFFNTNRAMNDLYYGSGILKGNMSITGRPDDIDLQIETTTLSGTRVHLPLDYSSEVYDKDYIIFVNTTADSLLIDEKENQLLINENTELKFNINLGMNITPIARISISLPSDMGDIESQGSGKLDMNFNSDGDFDLFGEYTVDRGRFRFTLENLVNKRFELVKGGRISWTGDPYTANVNLKGLYRVKANLNSLGLSIDTTTSYKNKVNVECYIKLTNKLLDPTISFEIQFPDLDPDLQRQIYALLDTTNVAMMNQQMISLLVLGTFSYSNASNYNLSTSGYTILTNQLSSMLSRISDDFDIGVNYKPGDNITNQEFEVALSTQLFDDRLIIDGNFGVSYDNSGQNASNIVGDVDVAYKLTEDGRWILKAYNHSNVNSWYYYNNYDKVSPYTQGVGVAFKKDFTTLKQLFRKRNKEKKTKEN